MGSGQAALYYAVSHLMQPGKNMILVPQLYGTTHSMFARFLPDLDIQVRFVESDNPDDVEQLINDDMRAICCGSVGNPAGNIADIDRLTEMAHRQEGHLVIDNTVAIARLLRSIDQGVDIVIHSLTKFMDSRGTTTGGAIVGSGKFRWSEHPHRFRMFSQPDRSYHSLIYNEHFGDPVFIARCRSVYLRMTGAVLSLFNAFMLLQSIETVLKFEIQGGFKGGTRFYDGLRLIKRVLSLGERKSLACHPASTKHRQMSTEEQRKVGVMPETSRLGIGMEHVDDIIADLHQTLDAAQGMLNGWVAALPPERGPQEWFS